MVSQAAPNETVAAVHQKFPCIDGLRAIAAALVVVYHGSLLLGLGGFAIRHWDVVGLLGPLGVCIFFVISGFLLYRPFLASLIDGAPFPSVRAFLWRRGFRIFPAYWVALTFFAVVLGQIDIPNVGDGLTFYGLVQNYRTGYTDRGVDVAWTLVIEVSFYLVLPIFAWLLWRVVRHVRSRRAIFWTNVAGVAAWYFAGMGVRIWDIYFRVNPLGTTGAWFEVPQTTRWLPGSLHWFAGGMALAFAAEWSARGGKLHRVLATLGRYPVIAWGIAAAFLTWEIAIDLPANVYTGSHFQGFVVTFATPLFATFLVLPAVLGDRQSVIRDVLRSPPAAWLGLVSYGIYLWHRPIMREVAARTSGNGSRTGLLWFGYRYAIVIALTLAVAAVSFYLIEQPLIRWSRRFRGFGRRRGPLARPAESTTPA